MRPWSVAELRLVVFDWDGTLMDSEARIVDSMRQAIAEVGLPSRPPALLREQIGLGLREAVAQLYPGLEQHTQSALMGAYREQFLGANPVPQAAFAGARETLQWLSGQSVTLAVATGKARRGLRRAFAETGLGDYFAHSRCADETASKPDPTMLQQLIEAAGVEPSQTLMVGDTEYDMEMAQRAGTHALAVSYGVHRVERLLRWPTLGAIDDIAELVGWWQSDRTGHGARGPVDGADDAPPGSA